MTTVLRGREPEMATLRRSVTTLPDGSGALVLRGGAGIGKSALLRAARDDAGPRGARVIALAGVQRFLVASETRWVTAQTIYCNGGMISPVN